MQKIAPRAGNLFRITTTAIAEALIALLVLVSGAGSAHLAMAAQGNTSADHLLISEVLYDTTSGTTADEWIEIYNPTSAEIDLSNYKLGDEETKGAGEGMYQFPVGSNIQAQSKIVVAVKSSAFYVLYSRKPDFEITETDPEVPNMAKYDTWGTGTLNLGNSGDEVLLLDANDSVIDVVTFESGLYTGVMPHPGVSKGDSLERYPVGIDTDDCSMDFIDQPIPNPETQPASTPPVPPEPPAPLEPPTEPNPNPDNGSNPPTPSQQEKDCFTEQEISIGVGIRFTIGHKLKVQVENSDIALEPEKLLPGDAGTGRFAFTVWSNDEVEYHMSNTNFTGDDTGINDDPTNGTDWGPDAKYDDDQNAPHSIDASRLSVTVDNNPYTKSTWEPLKSPNAPTGEAGVSKVVGLSLGPITYTDHAGHYQGILTLDVRQY